jgi:hypothetical protein
MGRLLRLMHGFVGDMCLVSLLLSSQRCVPNHQQGMPATPIRPGGTADAGWCMLPLLVSSKPLSCFQGFLFVGACWCSPAGDVYRCCLLGHAWM